MRRVERSDFRLPDINITSNCGVLRRPVESALAATVGVMNQARLRIASRESTAQGLDRQAALQSITRGPADNPS